SPDGKWALVRGSEGGVQAVPTGAGEAHLIQAGNAPIFGTGWFPDGKRVFFSSGPQAGERKLFVMDFPNGQPKQLSSEALRLGFRNVVVLPDGRSVALTRTASGRCILQPVEGGDPQPIPCPNGPVGGVSSDGKTWYVREGGVPAQLYRVDILSGRKQLWKQVEPPDAAGTYRMDNFLVTPDGKSYVYTYRRILSDLYLIEGLK
ncbi:MAG: TolB family protein, partial [Nevskiales bacterium]